jgi:hypothetical protein
MASASRSKAIVEVDTGNKIRIRDTDISIKYVIEKNPKASKSIIHIPKDLEGKKKTSFYISIRIPRNYPSTRLLKYLKKYNIKSLGHCTIVIYEKFAYVSHFYINAQDFNKISSKAEQIAFKGVGRQMLCFAISLAQMYSKNISYVWLHAQGGRCENVNITYKQALEVLDRYPKSNAYVDLPDPADKSLASRRSVRVFACKILDNVKLSEYYRKVYGFSVINDSYGWKITMGSSIEAVLQLCDGNGIYSKILLTDVKKALR